MARKLPEAKSWWVSPSKQFGVQVHPESIQAFWKHHPSSNVDMGWNMIKPQAKRKIKWLNQKRVCGGKKKKKDPLWLFPLSLQHTAHWKITFFFFHCHKLHLFLCKRWHFKWRRSQRHSMTMLFKNTKWSHQLILQT